jgi:hypothetical protein
MSIATQTGATIETVSSEFNAEDAFFTRMKGAKELPIENEPEEIEEEERELDAEEESEDQHEETPSEDDDKTEGDEESTEGDEEESEEESTEDKAKSEDDVIVKIKVDGKEHEVPVKDLKRLYGQEKALTRKSQEVADARKQIEDVGAKQTVALTKMFERAQERAKPYAQIDFLALTKDPSISGEELTALRVEAQRAFDDVNFYGQELDQVFQGAQAQRTQNLRAQAQEAVKVLSDPVNGIKGWDQTLYNDIRTYAVSKGLDAAVVNELTDPQAIKLIHKAMLYDKGQKALSNTTKIVKTPKKIMKSSSAEVTSKVKPKAGDKALAQLRQTGSQDAAEDLFLARMMK